MNDELTQIIPDPWKSLVHFLTIPVSWIPDMQRTLMDFVLASSTGWLSSRAARASCAGSTAGPQNG